MGTREYLNGSPFWGCRTRAVEATGETNSREKGLSLRGGEFGEHALVFYVLDGYFGACGNSWKQQNDPRGVLCTYLQQCAIYVSFSLMRLIEKRASTDGISELDREAILGRTSGNATVLRQKSPSSTWFSTEYCFQFYFFHHLHYVSSPLKSVVV